MPIQPFVPEGENDAELRRQFIDYTRYLLNEIVQNAAEGGTYAECVHPIARDHMQNAWEEALPLFQELQENMQQINDEAVRTHGLGGAQLRFKLANVEWWSQQENLTEQNFQTAMWIANIWRLLDSIDTLLESILAALGAGSALTEIKDSIKNGTH